MSVIREARLDAMRKRPVNLSLNEELVDQARALTDNLSAVVEDLLRQHVNERNGSFADENSTL